LEHLHLSTADVTEHEQFAFWRDNVNESLFGIRGEPLAATDKGFRASVEAWISPSLAKFRYSGDNLIVSRGPREAARRSWDSFWIYHEHGPGAWFDHSGRELVTAAGSLIVADADRAPFATRAKDDFCHDIWMVPKSLLAPHLPARGSPLWMPLPGVGLAALLAAYLQSLDREMSRLPPPQLDAVADNLTRLLAIIVGAPQGEHRQAMYAALAERVRAHIAGRLADPELAPASVAAALGVSERTLHHAFEPGGVSFAEEVTRRRLAECRTALANPLAADRSVADIAFGWGFQSLATFYCAFRREFGMAPGEVREAALRG
jgi:AraC-like DNA-binding protein